MKKVIITSKDITPKQWSNLLIELNLIRKAWKPYAKLEIHTSSLNKILRQGTRKYDARD